MIIYLIEKKTENIININLNNNNEIYNFNSTENTGFIN
jgi:hypothetical protein